MASSKRTSFYVKRSIGRGADQRDGWTGPIRSERQAHREAQAWLSAGWDAGVVASTPEVRREVRAWQRAADVRHGRRAS